MIGLSREPTARQEPAWRCEVSDAVHDLAWRADGRALAASAASGLVHLFGRDGLPAGEWNAHVGGASRLAWHPGQPWLASTGADGQVRVWDHQTGALRWQVKGPAGWSDHPAWSPDGAWLAFAVGKQAGMTTGDPGEVRWTPPHVSTLTALAWAPRGGRFAVAGYQGAWIHQPGPEVPARHLEWKGSCLSLAWSSDERFLAAGEQDCAMHLWFVKSGKDLRMWGYPAKVRELAWDATGRYLATAGGPQVTLWDCGGKGPAGTRPTVLEGGDSRITALAWSHRCNLLAAGHEDGRVVFWKPFARRSPVAEARFAAAITRLAWSPDQRALAAGDVSGAVGLINAWGES